jgi:hypothetical protein
MSAASLGAVAALAIAGCASSGSASATPKNGVASAVGYRWRVDQIRDGHGVLSIARSSHAEIALTRDGYVLGSDTVNGLQGRYRATRIGYAVTEPIIGGVGGTGGAPDQARIVSALDAMFAATSDSLTATPPKRIDVAVTTRGRTLVLTRGAISVTLVRARTEPNFVNAGGPSQTPTATPS